MLVCVCVVTLQEGQIGERDSVSEANRYVGGARKCPAGARIWGPLGPEILVDDIFSCYMVE